MFKSRIIESINTITGVSCSVVFSESSFIASQAVTAIIAGLAVIGTRITSKIDYVGKISSEASFMAHVISWLKVVIDGASRAVGLIRADGATRRAEDTYSNIGIVIS